MIAPNVLVFLYQIDRTSHLSYLSTSVWYHAPYFLLVYHDTNICVDKHNTKHYKRFLFYLMMSLLHTNNLLMVWIRDTNHLNFIASTCQSQQSNCNNYRLTENNIKYNPILILLKWCIDFIRPSPISFPEIIHHPKVLYGSLDQSVLVMV